MKTYKGSCHCGQVQFEIQTDLTTLIECNCSICRKKGALLHRVDAENFRLLSGEDALVLYQFNTKTAKHYFCKHCGIHSFNRPRTAPDLYVVNARCLDDVDLAAINIPVRRFDGRNWEEAVKTFQFQTETQ